MGIVSNMEAVIRTGIVQTTVVSFIGIIGIEIGIGELFTEPFEKFVHDIGIMDSLLICSNEGNARMIMRMIFFGHGRWNCNNNDLFVLSDVVYNCIKIRQYKFIANICEMPPFLYKGADMTSHIHLAIT